MMSLKHIFILFFVVIPSTLFAQKEKKVEGSYTYVVPENITLEQARRTALDRAKIQAIADEFGTVVTQSNTTFLRNENGNSLLDFQSLGGSEVKGEWIETFGEPLFEQGFAEDGQMWVRCTVKGKIREIVSAQIDIIAKVLRNGTEEKFEDYNFKNGDDMFLYFKSPVNGYLAVYLIDEVSKIAYCLLPYSQSPDAAQKIEHDKPYVFFSAKHVPLSERAIVDEMTMTCEMEQERNDLYIIFSPNAFVKANSENAIGTLPRTLSWHDFNEWLAKARKRDKDMINQIKAITINRRF